MQKQGDKNLDPNLAMENLPNTPTTLEGKDSQVSAYLDGKWDDAVPDSTKRGPETPKKAGTDEVESPHLLEDPDASLQVRGRKVSQYRGGLTDRSKRLLQKRIAKKLYNWAMDKKLFEKNQRGDALFQKDTIEQLVGVPYGKEQYDIDLADVRQRGRSGDMTRPATWDYCLVFKVGDNDVDVIYDSDDEECQEIKTKNHYVSGTVNQREDWLRKTFQVNRRIEDAGLTVAFHKDGRVDRSARRTTAPSTKISTASDRSMKADEDDDSQYIFCLVGADEATLREWADKSDYDLELDPLKTIEYGKFRKYALAQKTFMPDEMANPEEGVTKSFTIWNDLYAEYFDGKEKLYVKYYRDESQEDSAELTGMEKTSLFSTKDRYRLIYEAMIQDAAIGGGQLPLQLLAESADHPLVCFFPLHQENKLQWFRDEWLSNYSCTMLHYIPIPEIRQYFGEPIGFYFAFLQHYIYWLSFPALLGTIAFCTQLGVNEIGFEAIGLFMLGLCFWVVAMTDFWKRKQQLFIIDWGQSKYAEKEVRRPQFQGIWEISEVTGQPVKVQEKGRYRRRLLASFSFTLLYIAMVCTSMVLLMTYRVEQQRDQSEADFQFTSIWIGVVTAVCIILYDNIYYFLRIYLNNHENHRTQAGYENSNILKSFIFRFTNTFLSLFFIAFVQPAVYPDSYIEDGREMTEEERNDFVLYSLRIQLTTLFLAALFQQNFVELFGQRIFAWFMMRGQMKDAGFRRKWENRNTFELQRDMEPYPDTLEDMSELVIQFGYVTLFVVAFPLAPFIALCANIIEARVDGWKLVNSCRRPVPLGSNGLGMWTVILEVFSVIAVITNVCIYAFRTDRVAAVFGTEDSNGVKTVTTEEKQIFVIASAGILLLLSWIIRTIIPDIPESVKKHVDRQREIENVLIKNAAVDSDDEWDDFEGLGDVKMQDPGKEYLRSQDGDPRMKLSKILNYEEWNNMNGRMKININDRMSTLEPFISQVQPMPSIQ